MVVRMHVGDPHKLQAPYGSQSCLLPVPPVLLPPAALSTVQHGPPMLKQVHVHLRQKEACQIINTSIA